MWGIFSNTPKNKLTVGTSDFPFNHSAKVDTMSPNERPVIKIIDRDTHFCASTSVKIQSWKHVWKAMLQQCSLVFCVPRHFSRRKRPAIMCLQSFLESPPLQELLYMKHPLSHGHPNAQWSSTMRPWGKPARKYERTRPGISMTKRACKGPYLGSTAP